MIFIPFPDCFSKTRIADCNVIQCKFAVVIGLLKLMLLMNIYVLKRKYNK